MSAGRRSTGVERPESTRVETDAEMLQRLARGDVAALGELYERHQETVRRFVTRATAGGEDAEDVVHNAFLTAATISGRYDGRPVCRPWLIGIAARLVQRRSRSIARLARLRLWLSSGGAQATEPVGGLEARSALGGAARILAEMSPAKRVVVLMAAEQMTCHQIADELRIPIGTVWTRLHAARRELRAAIPKDSR